VWASSVLYLAFVLPSLVGIAVEPLEFLIYPGFFLFPYPFLLALQVLVEPGGFWSWLGGSVVGYLAVLALALAVQRIAGQGRPSGISKWPISAVAVAVALSTITVLAMGIAARNGWPSGE
jgi:hypothetical protein